MIPLLAEPPRDNSGRSTRAVGIILNLPRIKGEYERQYSYR